MFSQMEFGANTVSTPTTAADVTKPAEMVQKTVVAAPKPAPQTALELPIVTSDVNALSEPGINAIKARFFAERLAASTLIRSAPEIAKPQIAVGASPSADINTLRVSGRVVNARAKPTTSAKVLAKLRRGTEVVSTGQSKGKWAEVVVVETGVSVWMHSDFLTKQL